MNYNRSIIFAVIKNILFPVFLIAIVFIVYFGTATTWTFRPPWTIDFINPMAHALRQGRLDIPNPAMTYDLALYNGRWYMTWGALATIVHIPLQLVVGGRYVPALYTSLLFGSLTVGVVWQMLRQVRKDWFSEAPAWQTVALTFLYAFGTMQYYISTVGSIWQVNQVVSSFFGVSAIAVILKRKRSVRDYIASSALCGVALLGRPTVALLFVVPIFLFIDDIRRKVIELYVWKAVIAVTLPMLIAVTVVLAYNAARFGNPLETGHRFLTEAPELAVKRERYGMLSLSYLPTNVWHMIVSPPRFGWVKAPTMSIDLMGNSIFFLSPMLLFCLGTLPWIRSKKRGYVYIIRAIWLGILINATSSLLYYNTGWMQFGYRYALDFSFLLVILVYFWSAGRMRWWMVPLTVYTLWVNYVGIRLLQ